jgi:uncharacterized protein DUF5681
MPGTGRPFRKGQSGNPGGRPKAQHSITELARAHSVAAIETLVRVMEDGSPAAKVAAACAILDRGYGKPTQFQTGDIKAFKKAIDMTDDELAAIAAGDPPDGGCDDDTAVEETSDPEQLH